MMRSNDMRGRLKQEGVATGNCAKKEGLAEEDRRNAR